MNRMRWAEEVAKRSRTWLVTGGAGFVGSHLVSSLLELGQTVVALDDFSTGHRGNLDLIRSEVGADAWSRFSLIEGDIRDIDACRDACTTADVVLHQAALGSVPRSMKYPAETHAVNVDGTVNVFLASLEANVAKVVYASSSSVYGDEPTLPKTESRTGAPLSPYAASKKVCETYADTLARTHGLPTVGLRYFNVVGSRQDPEGPYAAVVPRWVDAFRQGHSPVIYGDGETSRDFCPVPNVVQANVLAALSPDRTNGKVYNIALGGRTTLNELFVLLRSALTHHGVDCAAIEPKHEDFREGDIRHSLADISAAISDLGYEPSVTLEQGLELAVR